VSRIESSQPAFISRAVTQARRFYLQLNPDLGQEFTVLCGGRERCAPDYEVHRRRFPYYGVEVVAEGRGWLELDGKSHRLEPGIAFVYGPETSHRIRTDPENCLVKYFVDVTGSACPALLEETGLGAGTCRGVEGLDAVTSAFEQVIATGLGGGRFSARITALLARVLLLRMTEAPLAKDAKRHSWRTFSRCRAYLDAHFLEVDSAKAAACACHIDPAYLSRLFAMHGCEPPYRYLMRKRMAHAAELLHEGRLIVREVADSLGMDAFQFSKAFKRVHGISPANFLARHNGRDRGKPPAISRR
jgi:AraC-like DNA-binding protein